MDIEGLLPLVCRAMRDGRLPLVKKPGFYVYGLTDPRSGHIRYIGKVNGYPNSRRRSHIYEARNGKRHNHRLAWIRKLLKDGFQPQVIILEACCDDASLRVAERRWITQFRVMGARLVNGTDGGEGMANPSEETRQKLRKRPQMGFTDEQRQMAYAAQRKRRASPEYRAALQARREARRAGVLQGEELEKFKVENAKKMGYKNRGKVRSSENRTQIASSLRAYYEENPHPHQGRKHSEETRAKMRAAWVRRKQRGEVVP